MNIRLFYSVFYQEDKRRVLSIYFLVYIGKDLRFLFIYYGGGIKCFNMFRIFKIFLGLYIRYEFIQLFFRLIIFENGIYYFFKLS